MFYVIRIEGKIMTAISPIRPKTINMMRLFKKRLVSESQLKALLFNMQDGERNLGALPYDWFERGISAAEKSTFSSMVFDIFADFAKGVRSVWFKPLSKTKIEALQKKLSKQVDMNASVKYLAEGAIGKTFKLRIKGKEYVLKIFHDCTGLDLVHGKSVEIANAISYCHAKKPSQRAKFFFGKIAREKDKDGFMIMEFIPANMGKEKEPAALLDYQRFKLGDDRRSNRIDGRLIDYGDISLKYSDKKEELIARMLLPLIKKGKVPQLLEIIKKYKSMPEFKVFLARLTEEGNSPALYYNGKFLQDLREKLEIIDNINF